MTNVDDVSPVCESYSYHVYVSDDTPPDPVQLFSGLHVTILTLFHFFM